MGQRVNGVYLPRIAECDSHRPLTNSGDNLLLMSREEFFAWLEENNKKAKPISQLIEEYEKEKHEDNRITITK